MKYTPLLFAFLLLNTNLIIPAIYAADCYGWCVNESYYTSPVVWESLWELRASVCGDYVSHGVWLGANGGQGSIQYHMGDFCSITIRGNGRIPTQLCWDATENIINQCLQNAASSSNGVYNYGFVFTVQKGLCINKKRVEDDTYIEIPHVIINVTKAEK